jgi:hypothetical protein
MSRKPLPITPLEVVADQLRRELRIALIRRRASLMGIWKR